MEFNIECTWNNFPVSHDPVVIKLTPENGGILMKVNAPFFNDPAAPPGEPGRPFNGLWDYEGTSTFYHKLKCFKFWQKLLCRVGLPCLKGVASSF